jgi:TM2 domain-containing membrane protein YozV
MSFGRKGLVDAPQLTPSQLMALRARPTAAPQPEPQAEAISPALAAFLAAERAMGTSQPGLSDIALETPRGGAIVSEPPRHIGFSGGLSLAKSPQSAPTASASASASLSASPSTFTAAPAPEPNRVTIIHRAERTLLLAYVLWFFTGGFGGHRHYLGRHGSAWAQMGVYWVGVAICISAIFGMNALMLGVGIVIAGGAGWWMIIDAFLIPRMVRDYNQQPTAAAFA